MRFGTSVMVFLAVALSIVPSVVSSKGKLGHCPPGLAKKNPSCVPPGQVGKRLSVGNGLPKSGYDLVKNPSKYRLPKLGKGQSYYRDADRFFRINRETREVLELIDALDAVLD